MKFIFNRKIYPKTAVIKAAYMFTDRAYIHLDTDETSYIAEVIMKPDYENITELEFDNEVLAQTARYEIGKKTRNIREMMVARAVASTVLIKEDTGTDPYLEDEITDTEDILTDWFDKYDNNKIQ